VSEIDRDQVVGALAEQFEVVVELCDELSDDQWATATCLPGWSVKDNVAHMAGTERMLLGEDAPEVDLGTAEHVRNDIGRFNEAWVAAARPLSGAEVLASFRVATAAHLAALAEMSQAQFDEPSWTPAGQATYGRFMRIRCFDCHLHEQDIREALGLALRTEPGPLQLTLDEVATGLGFVVGKRAALPGGTAVRFRLHDPDRVIDVDVAERATVVPSLERAPDVELVMPAVTFCRLVGGRRSASSPGTEGLEIRGDAALGRRLVEHLAFTV
jgi:uncharacterized protein (TIGR03083 family)